MKQTEIGLIPDDWEVKSLGDISDNCSYGVGAEAIAFNGKDRYIRITDIDDTSNKYVPQPLTSPSFFSSKDIVNENDILFARTGASVGKTYIYDKKDEKLIFAGFLMRLNIRNANSKFIFYNTITQRYKNWITSESMRTGQPGLNLEQLKSYLVAFPPLEEQQRIAKALSDVDALISTIELLIQKKKNIKQGAMQNLLTGKKRLPGFDGKWKQEMISNLCDRYDNLRIPVTATARKKGYVPYYGANGIQDYVEGYTHNGEFILIAEDGANSLADYPIQYTNGKIWVNNHAHVLQAKPEIADNKFLSYAFKTIDFESNIVGSGRAKLNSNILMMLEISVPPTISEQKAISNVLSSMDKEIETLNTKLEKYRNIKTAMMQQLLTGKIRLVKN